ncbi:MAG: hypothetical protein ACTHK4_02410 [Mycobacteriales bacterium]
MRTVAPLVAACCLLSAVGCGGTSGADKQAAAQAKAACEVFVQFHPPAGTGPKAQRALATGTYGAFLEAAHLARLAAEGDPRWRALQSATSREATAFQVIAKGTTGSARVDRPTLARAVAETAAARPIFVAQCEKADPGSFAAGGATASPEVSPSSS